MAPLSLDDWLVRLEALHPEDIELGLERVAAVYARLPALQGHSRVVTVAGTNGKGSTVTVLDALLRDTGLRTGVYTSPHLLRYNERICIDGRPVSDEALVHAFEQVDRAREQIPLTYFEFGTLAALLLFVEAGLDVVILEVGLGGRLDAVNIIDPDIAVITRVDLDHESWLGEDREQIGFEKAGILRRGIPFACADLAPPSTVVERARELGCQAWYVSQESLPRQVTGPLRPENIAAALQVAEWLGCELAASDLPGLLDTCRPPGRLQSLQVADRLVLFDVAHNPAAVENLARYLAQNPVPGRNLALFAALSDKKIRAMIRSCRAQLDAWWVAGLPGVGRALPAAELARELRACDAGDVAQCDSVAQAWHQAMDSMRAGDRLVVFGSFYTVAAVLPLLGE